MTGKRNRVQQSSKEGPGTRGIKRELIPYRSQTMACDMWRNRCRWSRPPDSRSGICDITVRRYSAFGGPEGQRWAAVEYSTHRFCADSVSILKAVPSRDKQAARNGRRWLEGETTGLLNPVLSRMLITPNRRHQVIACPLSQSSYRRCVVQDVQLL